MATIEAEAAGGGALVRAVEEALVSSWPALATVIDGAWVARMAGSYSGRANSLTILDSEDDRRAEERLDWVERLYHRAGLPCMLRQTPLTPPAVRAAADRRGYVHGKPTLALIRAIGAGSLLSRDFEAEVEGVPRSSWTGAFADVSGRPEPQPLARMLASLVVPHRFLLIRRDGIPAAMALAACHRELATMHSVATAANARRQGLARAMVAAALDWAAEQGARRAWLFVEEANAPARALYAGFGFKPLYAYAYRRQPGAGA